MSTRNWRYARDTPDGVHVPHSYVWGPRVTVHCAGGDLDHVEPDMRLIAAAPEMLEALQQVWMESELDDREAEIVKAAIAKATGESA